MPFPQRKHLKLRQTFNTCFGLDMIWSQRDFSQPWNARTKLPLTEYTDV